MYDHLVRFWGSGALGENFSIFYENYLTAFCNEDWFYKKVFISLIKKFIAISFANMLPNIFACFNIRTRIKYVLMNFCLAWNHSILLWAILNCCRHLGYYNQNISAVLFFNLFQVPLIFVNVFILSYWTLYSIHESWLVLFQSHIS